MEKHLCENFEEVLITDASVEYLLDENFFVRVFELLTNQSVKKHWSFCTDKTYFSDIFIGMGVDGFGDWIESLDAFNTVLN